MSPSARSGSLRVSGIFSFAPRGLFLKLLSHALRPFDRLRAGCGLYSFAALRLCSGQAFAAGIFGLGLSSFCLFLSFLGPRLVAHDSRLGKTSGVITPTAGARSRAIRVCCLHPGFRMSLAVPHSRGEVAGVASFLGLARRCIRALHSPDCAN